MLRATSLLFLVLSVTLVSSFGFTPSQVVAKKSSTTQLNGWLDKFIQKPVHGGGSADEGDLDDMWEAQQSILNARKGTSKDTLKSKYKRSQKMDLDTHFVTPTKQQKMMEEAHVREVMDDIVVDESAGFKFPWDKK